MQGRLSGATVGTEVKLKARVINVKDKRVAFEVDAVDKIEKIGEGLHERTVINVPEFRERFNKKLKKLETL